MHLYPPYVSQNAPAQKERQRPLLLQHRRKPPHRTRVVQRQVLYLGEINDSQREAWQHAIRVFDEERKAEREVAVYTSASVLPSHAEGCGVRVRLDAMELHRPRQWGACWLAAELWKQLDLDAFWSPRLGCSREGTDWTKVLQVLTIYRLLDPGSEWRLHRDWFESTALADLSLISPR